MGGRVPPAAISKGHIGLFLTFQPTFQPRQLDILTFQHFGLGSWTHPRDCREIAIAISAHTPLQ